MQRALAWAQLARTEQKSVHPALKMPRSVDIYCQQSGNSWYKVPAIKKLLNSYLIGLVVENINKLLGPSLSSMMAPFFRLAILYVCSIGHSVSCGDMVFSCLICQKVPVQSRSAGCAPCVGYLDHFTSLINHFLTL